MVKAEKDNQTVEIKQYFSKNSAGITMKTKNRLIVLLTILALTLVIGSTDALAASYTTTQSGAWSSASTWGGGGVPGSGDDATISAGHTVTTSSAVTVDAVTIAGTLTTSNVLTVGGTLQVNTGGTFNVGGNAQCDDLTLQTGASVLPDAGARNLTIDDDLTLAGTGSIDYTNGGGTGRLNLVLTGDEGTTTITAPTAANLKAYNVTVSGEVAWSGAGGMYVYGDFTVSGLGEMDLYTGGATPTVYFINSTEKTISGNGEAKFNNISVGQGSNTGTLSIDKELFIEGNISVVGTSELTIEASREIYLNQTAGSAATIDVASTGAMTISSSAYLYCYNTVNLTSDLSNVNGTLSVQASPATLVITADKEISGTGGVELVDTGTISFSNSQGLAQTIQTSGTNTLSGSSKHYTVRGGETEFSGASVTNVGNLSITGTVTTDDSFTVSGDLDVTGGNSFTASEGTITMDTGGETINNTGGTLSLYNLSITNTSGEIDLKNAMTLTGSFTQNGTGGTFDFETNTITMTSTAGSITVSAGTWGATGGGGGITINSSSAVVSLGSNLDLNDLALLTLTAGTLDFGTYTIDDMGQAPGVILTDGTVKVGATTGLAGHLLNYAANELTCQNEVSFEFTNSSTTSLGFTLAAAIGGDASGVASNITDITDLTITAGAITSQGTGNQNLDLLDDLTVASGATLNLSTETVRFLGDGAITNNGTLSFEDLTIGDGASGPDECTSSSDYTIKGTLTVDGTATHYGSLVNTNNTVTMTATSGAATIDETTANNGILTFHNITFNNSGGAIATANNCNLITINGDLTFGGGTANVNFAGVANNVTMSGSSKQIVDNGGGGTLTFSTFTPNGTITTTASFEAATIQTGTSTSGSLVASSPSVVTITAAGTVDQATNGGTLSFFDLTSAGAMTLTGASAITIKNDLTAGGAFTPNTSVLTMTGADGAATLTGNIIVYDLTLDGTASGVFTINAGDDVTTIDNSTITVGSGATLVCDTGPAVAAGGTPLGQTFVLSSGATLNVDAAGGVQAEIDATINTRTFNANANYYLNTNVTDAGFDAVTDMMDLTIAATGLIDLSANVSISGNLTVTGAGDYTEGTVTRIVTLDGSSKSISNSGTLKFGELNIATGATITTTSDFSVQKNAADALELLGTGSLICTGTSTATLETSAGTGITVASTANLELQNLSVAAACTGGQIADNSSFKISGNVTIVDGGVLQVAGTTTGTVTFDGTTTLTVNDAGNDPTVVTLNDVSVTGTVTTPTNPDAGMTISGDLAVAGSLTMQGTAAADGLRFDATAAHAVSGSGDITLCAIDADQGVTSSADITINGDIADALDIGHANGFTMSDGTTLTLAGDNGAANDYIEISAGALTVDDLVVSGADVNNDESFAVTGNITVTGDFVSDAGTVTHTGTSSITVSSPLVFYDYSITGASGNDITTASDFTVTHDFTLGQDATFVASSPSTVTLSGSGGGTLTNNSNNSESDCKFYNLTGAGSGDVSLSGTGVYVNGNLTNTGANNILFSAVADSKIYFAGSTEQTITNSSTGAIKFENMTVNNSNGIKLAGNIGDDELMVAEYLRLSSGDLDLNGNNVLTMDDAGTDPKLKETGGRVKNTGSSSSTGYIYYSDAAIGALSGATNVAGLGAKIKTGSNDPGTLTIKRYCTALQPGSSQGVSRFFEITSTNGSLDARLEFIYDDDELNGVSESSLELLRSNSRTGTWIVENDATHFTSDNLFRVDDIAQFTGTYSFWTAAAPSKITITEITGGIESSPLTADTDGKAILGFKLTNTGSADITQVVVDLTGNTTQFDDVYLYSSDDDIFDSDDTQIASDNAPGAQATFTVTGQTVSAGSPKLYFVVADINSAVTTSTSAVTPSVDQSDFTISGGVALTASITGTAYSFQPGMYITQVTNGTSESPLAAEHSGAVLMGYGIKGSSATSYTGLSVGFDSDVENYFENFKVYYSTDIDYDAGTLTQVGTGTWDDSNQEFDITFSSAQTLTTSYKYYFIVADVTGQVDASVSAVTPSIDPDDLTATSAGPVSTTTLSASPFEFVTSIVTVTNTNTPAASNIGRGVNDQTLFGFTLTPNTTHTVQFTGLTVTATFGSSASSSDFTNYRLWNDANGNGFPDSDENSFVGTYSSGQISFSSFGVAQTFSSATKYIVTANVLSNATVDGTITIKIPDQSYVTMASPTYVNEGGSWDGNAQTIKTPGTATALTITTSIVNSTTTINTTFDVVAQLVDANGTPVNASSTSVITITEDNGVATLAGTVTGSLLAGTSFVTVDDLYFSTGGVSNAVLKATDDGAIGTLTDPTTSNITVFTAVPSTQCSGITFGTATSTSIIVTSWTLGTGPDCILVMREGRPPADPTDGVDYTASTNISAAGDVGVGQTGPGSFVVYDGTGAGSNITVTGLTPGQTYYFQAYGYAGSGGLQNYNITNGSSDNPNTQATSAATTTDWFGSHHTLSDAASISTDIEVQGAITVASQADWYKFRVATGKNNLLITMTNVPANYTLELYNSAGTTLLRQSAINSTSGSETIIYNDATPGLYYIKVYGADSNQYDADDAYTLKVTTSASELMSQPSQ